MNQITVQTPVNKARENFPLIQLFPDTFLCSPIVSTTLIYSVRYTSKNHDDNNEASASKANVGKNGSMSAGDSSASGSEPQQTFLFAAFIAPPVNHPFPANVEVLDILSLSAQLFPAVDAAQYCYT
jgi:hypothetical protein